MMQAVPQETGFEPQGANAGMQGTDDEASQFEAGHDVQNVGTQIIAQDQHTRTPRIQFKRHARAQTQTLAPVKEVDDWKLALPPHYRRTGSYFTLQDRFSCNRSTVTFGTKVRCRTRSHLGYREKFLFCVENMN